MSRNIEESPIYIQDPLLLDFLKVQLHLTNYEVLTFVSIIFGNEQPTEIASDVKIPSSKIYSTLASLVNKGLIDKNNGIYKPNPIIFEEILRNAKDNMNNYINFIDNINSYAITSSRVVQTIKNDVEETFTKNNFNVYLSHDYFDLRNIGDEDILFERIIRRNRIIFQRYDTNDVDNRRVLINEVLGMIDIIGESITSGIKIGISIIDKIPLNIPSRFMYRIYEELKNIFNIQYLMIITTPKITISEYKLINNEFNKRTKGQLKNYFIISSINNLQISINEFIDSIERLWRDNRIKLNELTLLCDQIKEKIRSYMVDLNDIMTEITYPSSYRKIYENMLLRVRRDLQNYDLMLYGLEEQIRFAFYNLDRKILLERDTIIKMENDFKEISNNINEKTIEIENYRTEIITFRSDKNPYEKYGYIVNPFSLKVPLDQPYKIINQDSATAIMNNYIESVNSGTANNLLFMMADEGGGKSHFLNYYSNKINQGDYGKNIAIKIECRPRSDLIDLLPQISNELNLILKEKEDLELISSIQEVFAESGVPRSISDLLNILRNISIRLSKYGFLSLYILLDEFENTLPSEINVGRNIPFSPGSPRIGTPETITQLDSISQLDYIGFIVTLRKTGFDRWSKQILERIIKFDNDLLIHLESFNEHYTEELISHRLKEYRIEDCDLELPTFTDKIIKEIYAQSKGNPRTILRLSEKAFRKGITSGNMEITLDYI